MVDFVTVTSPVNFRLRCVESLLQHKIAQATAATDAPFTTVELYDSMVLSDRSNTTYHLFFIVYSSLVLFSS